MLAGDLPIAALVKPVVVLALEPQVAEIEGDDGEEVQQVEVVEMELVEDGEKEEHLDPVPRS
jgi:hypothetical protein